MKKTMIYAVEKLLEECRSKGHRLASAESCTGGLIAAALTEIAGASDVFDRGFVTYSNQAKSEMLGVPKDLIAQEGAVSEFVARHMAEGALNHSDADIAVAVTGIAGPDGGSDDKPIGLVHIAVARAGQATRHERCLFKPKSRKNIRRKTVIHALKMIGDEISQPILA